MPMRAFKRKARQWSALNLDNSTSIRSQQVGAEKSSLTDERISEITQQIECKIVRELKDESRKTENTTLRILGSMSENSLNGDFNNMSVGTSLSGKRKWTGLPWVLRTRLRPGKRYPWKCACQFWNRISWQRVLSDCKKSENCPVNRTT